MYPLSHCGGLPDGRSYCEIAAFSEHNLQYTRAARSGSDDNRDEHTNIFEAHKLYARVTPHKGKNMMRQKAR